MKTRSLDTIRLVPILAPLLVSLLTACGAEGPDGNTVFFDPGQVTPTPDANPDNPDNNPDNNPDVINNPAVARNNPAIITGINSGTLTEDDVDPGTNLLTASGKLEITDSDTGEDGFNPVDITVDEGSFVLQADGNWQFSANNDLDIIQNLPAGQTLTVTLNVNSIDLTVHTISIFVDGVDDAALISGTDTGSVTEDDDPDGNNQLEASGKLEISDIDTDEASFVQQVYAGSYGELNLMADGSWTYSASNLLVDIQRLGAGETQLDTITVNSLGASSHDITITINGTDDFTFISGDDAVTLIEDDDPDGDTLLEASGILNIFDGDNPDAAFIASNSTGSYGDFSLDAAGNWSYSADNTQTAIQDLTNGASLTDTFTINSDNGTPHDVVFTFKSYDLTVSWTAPFQREDGSAIAPAEIDGFNIYYGTTMGDYQYTSQIADGTVTEHTIEGMAANTYYFVVTSYDTEARESLYSNETTLSNQ